MVQRDGKFHFLMEKIVTHAKFDAPEGRGFNNDTRNI
jgi:hypothetical protein